MDGNDGGTVQQERSLLLRKPDVLVQRDLWPDV